MSIPAELLESLARYVDHGIPTGQFLRACLENDFLNAVCRADESNRPHLRAIAQFIHNELPSDCHGSPEAVRAWLASPRFKAKADNAAACYVPH